MDEAEREFNSWKHLPETKKVLRHLKKLIYEVNEGCDYRSLANVEKETANDLIQYNAGYIDGLEVLLNLESDFMEEVDGE